MVNSFKVEYNLYSITKRCVYQSLSNANYLRLVLKRFTNKSLFKCFWGFALGKKKRRRDNFKCT